MGQGPSHAGWNLQSCLRGCARRPTGPLLLPRIESQGPGRSKQPQAGGDRNPLSPASLRGDQVCPQSSKQLGVQLGWGSACNWVSLHSATRAWHARWRLGRTDSMLTMIPAQNGVSLTSREGLMLAMRKPSTVTAMPRASCSSASSSGKRQPQQVRASSSTSSCAPGLALRPMFRSVVAAVAAPGPRLGLPGRQRRG